ncbi:HD domain-containing protein [Candidatus Pacearchaeota archaeon]|nr:HD domain-containing protein [Candidatus Pacearchaeota archaeon]
MLIARDKKLFKSILKEEHVQEHLRVLKKHHKETYYHSLRIGLLGIKIGYKNSLPKRQIKLLGYAGLFHDLGKLNVHKKILSKSFPLNDDEKKMIKQHPRWAFLKLIAFKEGDVKKIIIQNHEYGKDPYPRKGKDRRETKREFEERRKKDLEIDKLVQIIAIIDMYDALAHKRSYKEPLDKKKISEILKKEFKGDKIYIDQILNL